MSPRRLLLRGLDLCLLQGRAPRVRGGLLAQVADLLRVRLTLTLTVTLTLALTVTRTRTRTRTLARWLTSNVARRSARRW